MKSKHKNLLELKKESIVALNKLQTVNIAGGYAENGLTSLNMCEPPTGSLTIGNTSGNTSDMKTV